MTLADVEHWFKAQIDERQEDLYYMVVDKGTRIVKSCPSGDIGELVGSLRGCVFDGFSPEYMPRFVKYNQG